MTEATLSYTPAMRQAVRMDASNPRLLAAPCSRAGNADRAGLSLNFLNIRLFGTGLTLNFLNIRRALGATEAPA